jgi:hypothetical protein
MGRNGGLSNEFGRLMQRVEIVAPVGREKKGRGRQVRTKSFHSLRHTFVSGLANADVSTAVRKALAGHDTDEAHACYGAPQGPALAGGVLGPFFRHACGDQDLMEFGLRLHPPCDGNRQNRARASTNNNRVDFLTCTTSARHLMP